MKRIESVDDLVEIDIDQVAGFSREELQKMIDAAEDGSEFADLPLIPGPGAILARLPQDVRARVLADANATNRSIEDIIVELLGQEYAA